ncbi:Shr3p KNAG_0L02270 [Huiozyma naganishii CBS 8797]|uniref:Shr3 amino acid permease chaperone n=1 Tax=Huiozyma naganishii (strain ATCC MYA-139 / BCRC 22969 / CBS 8797 / KCTC 17520 / NBRC 10181 / NCYC 3082 / Yp74L-3) TaxID=1071383 RepID=J7RSE7_HUIN7|nr:hypothetical protein KNAG_0L02270 [Kazachstania naganishii CBS 8797]CCK72843.1 hypothetical protein KNAG_0L02270 [Kazachstania naganishii CBS 8797]
MVSYKELCAVSQAVIVGTTCFVSGVFYNNLSYDFHILFPGSSPITDEHFANSLRHYQLLYGTHRFLVYTLGVIAMLGVLAHVVRTYKPNPELQYFEYGSLILYILGVCIFITNIKTGMECAITHQWGEVTENEGLAVLGCSNIIMIAIFTGVLFIQFGLWYSTNDYEKRLKAFQEEEEAEAKAKAKESSTKKGKRNSNNKKNK